MIVGTRMLYPEEVRYWNAEILQISVYRGMKDNLRYMRECVSACRAEDDHSPEAFEKALGL